MAVQGEGKPKMRKQVLLLLLLVLNLFLTGCEDENKTILITQQLSSSMGEVSLNNNTQATVINSANTWTQVMGNWTGNNQNMEFTTTSDGNLTYTGSEPRFFHIAATLSLKSSGPNDIAKAVIFKNGVALSAGEVEQKLFGSGDIVSTAIHVAVVLSPGDKLDMRVLNEIDADDLVVTYGNLFAMGMKIT